MKSKTPLADEMAGGLREISDKLARRWSEDDEPREPADRVGRAPARFYAPAGQCEFCDRRRAAAKVTMRGVRERGGG